MSRLELGFRAAVTDHVESYSRPTAWAINTKHGTHIAYHITGSHMHWFGGQKIKGQGHVTVAWLLVKCAVAVVCCCCRRGTARRMTAQFSSFCKAYWPLVDDRVLVLYLRPVDDVSEAKAPRNICSSDADCDYDVIMWRHNDSRFPWFFQLMRSLVFCLWFLLCPGRGAKLVV